MLSNTNSSLQSLAGKLSTTKKREMMSTPPRLERLGLKNLVGTASFEYDNSFNITLRLKNLLLDKNEEGAREASDSINGNKDNRQD